MPSFEVLTPSSLKEVLSLLSENVEGTLLYAGGTDLMPLMRRGKVIPKRIIDLSGITELNYLIQENNTFHVGSLTRIHDFANSPLIPKKYFSIKSLGVYFGSEATRHMATIGGNLASGGERDVPAILSSLEGRVKISSSHNVRFSNPLDVRLQPDELIVEASFDDWGANTVSWFTKFEKRASNGIGVVTATVTMKVVDRVIEKVRIVLNRVNGRKMDRLVGLEEELTGVRPTSSIIKDAVEKHVAKIKPASDFRASSDFRRHVSKVLIRRGLEFCWEQLKGGMDGEN